MNQGLQEQVEKIRYVRKWIEDHNGQQLIEVDGGVNNETVKMCDDADVLVAGSYVFKNDYRQAIQILKGEK